MKREVKSRGLFRHVITTPETEAEERELLGSLADSWNIDDYLKTAEDGAREILAAAGIDADTVWEWVEHPADTLTLDEIAGLPQVKPRLPGEGQSIRFVSRSELIQNCATAEPNVSQAIDLLIIIERIRQNGARFDDKEAHKAFWDGVEVEAALGALRANAIWEPLVSARRRQKGAFKKFQEGKAISDEERHKVRTLDDTLAEQFPMPTVRYLEIANKLGIKLDRVRYIVEGPRKKKKK